MTGDPKIPPLDVIMGACDDACAYDLGSYSTAILVAAALDAAGYVIVPKEPTFEMKSAGLRAGYAHAEPAILRMKARDAEREPPTHEWMAVSVACGNGGMFDAAYRAMLAASQQKAGQ
jgi:hypothetical protein